MARTPAEGSAGDAAVRHDEYTEDQLLAYLESRSVDADESPSQQVLQELVKRFAEQYYAVVGSPNKATQCEVSRLQGDLHVRNLPTVEENEILSQWDNVNGDDGVSLFGWTVFATKWSITVRKRSVTFANRENNVVILSTKPEYELQFYPPGSALGKNLTVIHREGQTLSFCLPDELISVLRKWWKETL
jgi:hypothetical protein